MISGSSLSGTVTYEGWSDLTNIRIPNGVAQQAPPAGGSSTRPYGNHGNTAGWYNWIYDSELSQYTATTPSTIASNLGAGSSTLWKSSGYGYVGSASIHQGFSGFDLGAGGVFRLDSSAMAGLQTVVFQIQATNRQDEIFHSLPTLTFGSTTLSANYSRLFDRVVNYGSFGSEFQDLDSYAFQWDLSGYTIAGGEALSIEWTGVRNSGIFGLQLNQGEEFVQVVPEPSISALLIAVGLVFLTRSRRSGRSISQN